MCRLAGGGRAMDNSAFMDMNAMSVDVEDYFHVSAFRQAVRPEDWERFPPRIERNVSRVLDIFAERQVTATFFWLGWVAERWPRLLRRCADAGHEIGSHGYSHVRVHDQTAAAFRADVVRTKALLEDLSGREVVGYRAASFSIDSRNLWALDELARAGYGYSSSINPISHDHYGMREAPRFAFQPRSGGIIEVPVSTVEVLGNRFPCGGGGFFRLYPYVLSRWALRRINARDGRAAVFYFHPWEVDPDQPRVSGIDRRARFRHYVNLRQFQGKLERLLADFRWGPVRGLLPVQP